MAAEDDLDMPLDHISRQLDPIIIPPRNFDHEDDTLPAPSEYEGDESWGTTGFTGGHSSRVPLLDFALGRPWNRDDTRRILTYIGDVIVDQSSTGYQHVEIMHLVVCEYLVENQTGANFVGPEWYDNNIEDLHPEIVVQIRELLMEEEDGEVGPVHSWSQPAVQLDDPWTDDDGPILFYGGGGLSKETIREHLRTRVCRGDELVVVGEEKTCTICQDELYQEKGTLGTLKCGHEYHVDCIEPWLRQTNICPLCRAKALDVHS